MFRVYFWPLLHGTFTSIQNKTGTMRSPRRKNDGAFEVFGKKRNEQHSISSVEERSSGHSNGPE